MRKKKLKIAIIATMPKSAWFPSYQRYRSQILIAQIEVLNHLVFILIFNQIELRLVHNHKENCHCDYILFNIIVNENIFLYVYECARIFRRRTLRHGTVRRKKKI